MWQWWRRWRVEGRSAAEAKRRYRRARALYEDERDRDAIALLQDAIALLGDPDPGRPSYPPLTLYVRLPSLQLLAQAAARAGERTTASSAIIAATQIIADVRRRVPEAMADLRAWEQWAAAYLVSQTGD